MAYATTTDMTERIGEQTLIQLSDLESSGVVDESRVEAAIADGDGLIDSYISQRYALPLPGASPLLTGISCDLAVHRLHRHGAPEEVRRMKEAAIELLERIAKGEVRLDIGGAEPPTVGGGGEFEGPDRVFNRDTMEGF